MRLFRRFLEHRFARLYRDLRRRSLTDAVGRLPYTRVNGPGGMRACVPKRTMPVRTSHHEYSSQKEAP